LIVAWAWDTFPQPLLTSHVLVNRTMSLKFIFAFCFICSQGSVAFEAVKEHEATNASATYLLAPKQHKPITAVKLRAAPANAAAALVVQPTGRPEKNETAAEATGVATNAAGDLNAFVAALITNIITIIIFFLVAGCLHKNFPLVYQKEVLTLADHVKDMDVDMSECPPELLDMMNQTASEKAPAELLDRESFWGWWKASDAVQIDDAIKYRGLDQAMLLQFAELAKTILAAIGMPLVLVMGPCHCFLGGYRAGAPGTDDADYLSYWGMANVVDGHPWLYWAHALVMWGVVCTVQGLIFNAMKTFMKRRNIWLKQLPHPRSTTVLVEGIPPEYQHDDKLTEYFNNIFGTPVIEKASIVKDTSQLLSMVKTYKKAEEAFETKKHAVNHKGESNEGMAELEEAMKKAKDDVDAEKKVVLEKAQSPDEDKNPNLSKGFVTFKARRDAELAKMMVFNANAEIFVVSIPPDPADVIYTDLQQDPTAERVRAVIGYALIAGVFWAYLPAVVLIAYYTSIQTLAEYSDTFKSMAEDEATAALWDGMVNALALQLFIAFVPTMFVAIFSNFFVLKADAWLQHRIQEWYYYFQVIFVLLVTAVGSSLVDTLETLAENPLSIFNLLATTLPMSTHFYLNFLPLQWVTHAQNLLRTSNLGKFMVWRKLLGVPAGIAKAEPEDQDYYGIGSRSARFGFMLTLVLAFCSLSPLIVILGWVNFWVCRKVYGYLCVFCEKKKPDLGGVFYVSQLTHIQEGMFIYIILMAGVLLERSATRTPGLIAASALIFQRVAYGRFFTSNRWESLTFQEIRDMGEPDIKSKKELIYVQPELA